MSEFVRYIHQDPIRRPMPVQAPALPPLARRINPEALCGRGCCWTPFGVCPLERRCGCHRVHAKPPEPALVDFIADEADEADEDGNPVEDCQALAAAA